MKAKKKKQRHSNLSALRVSLLRMTPRLIDYLAEKYDVSQEVAANELLMNLLACGQELHEDHQPLVAQPLKIAVRLMTREIARQRGKNVLHSIKTSRIH